MSAAAVGPAADPAVVATRLLGRPATVVGELRGGVHARTTVVTDGTDRFVLRIFPDGDPAVARELDVLPRLVPLGALVPRLVAADPAVPAVLTTLIEGGPPPPDLSADALAEQLGTVLARVHALDGSGLRAAPVGPADGSSELAVAARREWPGLDRSAPVLAHFDFWSGNTLWRGDRLVGVVDWSGARSAPAGLDLAWCRLDLVLLGSPAAADRLVDAYGTAGGRPPHSLRAWDRHVAAHAEPDVPSWSENYVGVGRPELTADALTARFAAWTTVLLTDGSRT